MSRRKNLFRASFGAPPPVLVGRDEVLDDFVMALESGPGTHERISVVTGACGVGKTALLNAFEDEAQEAGWRIFSETATSGFAGRLRDGMLRAVGEIEGRGLQVKVWKVSAFGASVEFGDPAQQPIPGVTLRDAWAALLDSQTNLDAKVGQESTGVLVTIDEPHHLRRDELVDFAVAVRHLVRGSREMAVVMAGIPQAVKPLFASDEDRSPITFLRRAKRIHLGRVGDGDVARGLSEAIDGTGVIWDEDALAHEVSACGGYPFMIQLVGQWSFNSAAGDRIDLEAAEKGAGKARRKLGQLVHEPALADLSDVDRSFLAVMSLDEGRSRTADIAKRLNVSSQYVNAYRNRLIDADMIHSPAHGYVDFSLPYLRDYLREHGVSDVLGH